MQYCPLCQKTNAVKPYFTNTTGQLFYSCADCGFIFRSPESFLTKGENEARYKLHQNDVLDKGYQNFLRPVVNAVLSKQSPLEQGLDYGCGPESVIQYLLLEAGFQMETYDPLFHPEEEILNQRFDYVTCTEVVEHFEKPLEEMSKIKRLLKPLGRLYIKTSLTDAVHDFPRWHYHRDPSHVSFFSRKSFEFIQAKLGFAGVAFKEPDITIFSDPF
jgi:SAM-dependent methyltransferase